MTYQRDPGLIIEDAYHEFFTYLDDSIRRDDIERKVLDRYLLRYYGDIYDEWLEWCEAGEA